MVTKRWRKISAGIACAALAICLASILGFPVLNSRYPGPLPVVPPALDMAWDLREAGAEFVMVFHVSTDGSYKMQIGFHWDQNTDMQRLNEFVGSGAWMWMTQDENGWRRLKNDGSDGAWAEIDRRGNRGDYKREWIGGTDIPLRVTIARTGEQIQTLSDDVIETKNLSNIRNLGRGHGVRSRDVTGWRLSRGDYKVTVGAIQPSAVPKDAWTSIEIRQDFVK